MDEQISRKKKIIHKKIKHLKKKVKIHNKRYKKLKIIDDVIDGTNSVLTGATIALIITGIGIPPLLIVGASSSGIAFLIQRLQDKINFKEKYHKHLLIRKQYGDLCREIEAVLTHNDLTSEKLSSYIEEINQRINLIEDNNNFAYEDEDSKISNE